MNVTYEHIVIAGAEVKAQLDAERAAIVEMKARGYDSEQLCELQRKQASRGYLECEIVKSNYGYSVRYASGLQNWGLLRAAKHQADDARSLEAAEEFCRNWVAQDPARRFATRTVSHWN